MKAKEFISNQNVALNFFWDSINIQVRIQGVINKLDEKKSDKYFYSRDIKKNLLAIISKQSESLDSYKTFTEKFYDELNHKDITFLESDQIFRGYTINASSIEFWEGNRNRLNKEYHIKKLIMTGKK